MPYASVAELPASVKKLSAKEQRQWLHVFNSAHKRCTSKGGEGKTCDSSAFAQAFGVVGKAEHSADAPTAEQILLAAVQQLRNGTTATFADWSQAMQNDLPDSAFLYVEPGGKKDSSGKTTPRGKRHLPIRGQDGKLDLSHLRNAISRLGQGATLPGLGASAKQKLQTRAQGMLSSAHAGKDEHYAGDIARFSLDETPDTSLFESDDGMVYRGGLIFRAGDYPDKNYSMTPDELVAAVEAFSDSLNVDLEHVPTLLDGQLGQVVSVSTNEDNTEFHGIVVLPKWLDTILPERKVSATWDRETKTLAGLALVRNPRVEDAALMAAFAETKRHDTYEGQSALQQIHDETTRRGAVCKAPSASMASAHESSAIQKVHDMTAEHGAKCSAIGDKTRGYPWFSLGSDPAQASREDKRMSRFEEFMAWLKGDETAEGDPTVTAAAATTTETKPAATVATPTQTAPAVAMSASDKDENARLREENRVLRMQGIHDRAIAFADKVELEGYIVPAQKDGVVKMHMQAATDDAFVGTAAFADGESRVSNYETSVKSQPRHMLTTETLPQALKDVVALSNTMKTSPTTGDGPMSMERRKELMGHDPVASQVFQEKYATGSNGTGKH